MQFLSVCPRNMKGFQNPRHFPLQPIMGACPTNKPSQPQQAFWSMFCRSDGSSGCGLLAGATSAMATPRLVAVRGTSLWQPPGSWMLILTHLISSCLPATQQLWGRGDQGTKPCTLVGQEFMGQCLYVAIRNTKQQSWDLEMYCWALPAIPFFSAFYGI